MALSNRLNQIISEQNISKTEFARRLSITVNYVYILTGNSRPDTEQNKTISPSLAKLIALEFGYNADWFSTETAQKSNMENAIRYYAIIFVSPYIENKKGLRYHKIEVSYPFSRVFRSTYAKVPYFYLLNCAIVLAMACSPSFPSNSAASPKSICSDFTVLFTCIELSPLFARGFSFSSSIMRRTISSIASTSTGADCGISGISLQCK